MIKEKIILKKNIISIFTIVGIIVGIAGVVIAITKKR